tara:strand:+ start:831 stop:1853 length:1023 start_codon:yes stop_codon:yes gene_type:complete
MAEVGPGAASTYVPTFSEATGLVQVEYSRNPASFAVNSYAKLIPVSKDTGYYLRIDEEESARIGSLSDTVWQDGNDAPEGIQQDHEFSTFRTQRHAPTFVLGQKAAGNADFEIVASHARMAASKAMRIRSLRAATELTTSGNWGSDSTDSATNVGGGQFQDATSTNNYIQKSFNGVSEAILANTNEAVTASDIVAVMSDVTAHSITESEEYRTYFQGSPFAANFVRGAGEFNEFLLLSTFFGVGGIVVDPTARVTNRKGGTTARTRIFDDDVVFVSRPGGQMGTEGVPDFSTLSIFAYEDMTVETEDDTWNRRVRGRVVDDSAVVLTAPLSGYLLTDVWD